jgi:3-oxoacyl-[acyl-carrier-protein] synthase-3
MSIRKARLKAITSYTPKNLLTNETLAQRYPQWDMKKIYENTGVAVRPVVGPEECTSDLGIKAAQKLFDRGEYQKNLIDFILFGTQTPDYYLPASACVMQDRLGLPKTCGALDFNLGCSGYVYGLALAKTLIEANLANNILLIVGDTLSKVVSPQDRSALPLFGDAASATLISVIESHDEEIGPFIFGTDGKGAKNLIIPAGGFRLRPGPETEEMKEDQSGCSRCQENLFMDGAEIFNFALRTVPKAVNLLLDRSSLQREDVDLFILHQANKIMLEALRRKMKIPQEKFCINLEKIGNTSSATIPMALETAIDQGRLTRGKKVLMVGFGVGYSWAAGMLKI